MLGVATVSLASLVRLLQTRPNINQQVTKLSSQTDCCERNRNQVVSFSSCFNEKESFKLSRSTRDVG